MIADTVFHVSFGSTPIHLVAAALGSRSTRRVVNPDLAAMVARLTAVAVFETPPASL